MANKRASSITMDEAIASLDTFRVADLKSVLRQLNLTLSGVKNHLKQRIIAFMHADDANFRNAAAAIKNVRDGAAPPVRRRVVQSQRQYIPHNLFGGYDSQSMADLFQDHVRHMYGGGHGSVNLYRAPAPVRRRLAQEDVEQSLRSLDSCTEHIQVLLPAVTVKNHLTIGFVIPPRIQAKLAAQAHNAGSDKQELAVEVRCVSVTQTTAEAEASPNRARQKWPRGTALEINNRDVVVAQSHPIGSGQKGNKMMKERPADVTTLVDKDVNKLVMGAFVDAGDEYAISIDLVRRIPLAEIVDKLNKTQLFNKTDGLARIIKMFKGGDDDDDDDDDIVIATSMISRLKCPLGLNRIGVPARGSACPHLQCFDLSNFISFQMTAKNATWQCPVCSRPVTVEDIVVDEWFQNMLAESKKHGTDVDSIEVDMDGSWKPRFNNGRGLASAGTLANAGGLAGDVKGEVVGNTCKGSSNSITGGTSSTGRSEIDLLSDSDSEAEDEEERKLFAKLKNRSSTGSAVGGSGAAASVRVVSSSTAAVPRYGGNGPGPGANAFGNGAALYGSSSAPHHLSTLMGSSTPPPFLPSGELAGGYSSSSYGGAAAAASSSSSSAQQQQQALSHLIATGASFEDAIDILSDSEDGEANMDVSDGGVNGGQRGSGLGGTGGGYGSGSSHPYAFSDSLPLND